MMKKSLLAVAVMCASCGDPSMPGADRHYIDVATGGLHTCAIADNNQAYCWGRGADGELGTGTTTNQMFPAAVNTTLKFKQITTGAAHTCAIGMDDLVYCWGWNVFYQLGDSTTTSRLTPQPIAFGLRFKQISAGAYHTCGITSDSKVYCWGYNRFGQNGNGTTQVTIYPVQVTGNLRAAFVTGGGQHTCAIATAGGAYCWGSNELGQLGIGSDKPFVTDPASVVGGVEFTSIDGGENHTCAIDRRALPSCWGYNEFGQIGDAAPWRPGLAGPASPVAVILLTDVTSISAGVNHTCAIDTTGRTWCWGRGTYGQLAVGSTQDYSTRQPVVFQPRLQNTSDRLVFTKLATGGATHACALGEGSVYCWGSGRSGELGSRTTYVTTPQRVD